MKRVLMSVVSTMMVVCFLAGAGMAKEKVVIYTALENDEVVKYLALAEKELPDLELQAIRLSTGELGARMLAERSNPQVDVIWGWALTNMAEFVDRDLLTPYKPVGWEKIPDKFKDANGYWTAIDLYAAAFVGNTKVLEAKNLKMPKSWNELLDPGYKGLLIMPNPASSGTGFLQIASLLVLMDPAYKSKSVKDNLAWDYLKKLDANMGQYIKSGSKPAKLTASGEYAVGCSFAYVYASLKDKGFPVEMALPAEGVGFELEANALAKGAKHEAAAKKFLDWAIGKSAMELYAEFKLGVTYPGVAGPKNLPPIASVNLAPMDFPWQSTHREEILNTWSELFIK